MSRLSRSALLLMAMLPLMACDPNLPPPGGKVDSDERQTHRKRRGVPEGTHEGSGGSLLAAHADRDLYPQSEIDQFKLTGSAKALAVALLTVAAKDRIEDLPALLTDGASWGLPDRRELDRREIFDDGGEDFMTALRTSASRFKKDATFSCPPLMPAMETFVATGAEPMWCFYMSDDRVDLLVFKLVAPAGKARIAYVGFFEERPTGMMPVRLDLGAPPPTVPPPKMRGLDRPMVMGPGGPGGMGRPPGGGLPSGVQAQIIRANGDVEVIGDTKPGEDVKTDAPEGAAPDDG
jgi:hypothetical protein